MAPRTHHRTTRLPGYPMMPATQALTLVDHPNIAQRVPRNTGLFIFHARLPTHRFICLILLHAAHSMIILYDRQHILVLTLNFLSAMLPARNQEDQH
jgi:hypothetical protein